MINKSTDEQPTVSPEIAAVIAGACKTSVHPGHVEDALQAMATMHATHHDKASTVERYIDRATAIVAAPRFFLLVFAAILSWFAINIVLDLNHVDLSDAPNFSILGIVVDCSALLIAILILGSQTRADKLTSLQEKMTLEMSLVTTQKVSKLIDLIEELRRDSPNVKDRVDLEAIEMSSKPDHETVLQAIQDVGDQSAVASPSASRQQNEAGQ